MEEKKHEFEQLPPEEGRQEELPSAIQPKKKTERVVPGAAALKPAVPPAPVVSDDDAAEIVEDETEEIKKDKEYIKQAEEIIEKYDEKPHQEEESSEDLQIQFLKKKYGKDIKKSKE